MALEKKEKRILYLTEYRPQFLIWAKKILGEEYNWTNEEKKSIAKACADKMNERAWSVRIKKYLKRRGAAKKPCGSDTTDERSSRDGTSPRHSVWNADEIIDNDPTSASKSTRRPSPELSSSEIRHLRAEINRELARQRKKRAVKVTKRESKAAVQKSSKGRVRSRPPKPPPDALQKPKSAQVMFPTVLVSYEVLLRTLRMCSDTPRFRRHWTSRQAGSWQDPKPSPVTLRPASKEMPTITSFMTAHHVLLRSPVSLHLNIPRFKHDAGKQRVEVKVQSRNRM